MESAAQQDLMIVSEQPSTQRQRAKLCLSKRVFYIFVCFLIIVFGILPVVVEVVWGLICAQVARFRTMVASFLPSAQQEKGYIDLEAGHALTAKLQDPRLPTQQPSKTTVPKPLPGTLPVAFKPVVFKSARTEAPPSQPVPAYISPVKPAHAQAPGHCVVVVCPEEEAQDLLMEDQGDETRWQELLEEVAVMDRITRRWYC